TPVDSTPAEEDEFAGMTSAQKKKAKKEKKKRESLAAEKQEPAPEEEAKPVPTEEEQPASTEDVKDLSVDATNILPAPEVEASPEPVAENQAALEDTAKTDEAPSTDADPSLAGSVHDAAAEAAAEEAEFAGMTPAQKKMQDRLRDLEWNDAAIHNILAILEDVQRYNRERLHEKGCAEDEIQRLDALANENVIDFSHLRRGLTSAGEEDYQVQLYLLEEVKRRRVAMLEEEGE
ncbi:hypothetical protein LTR66_017029, partial [Elasticomyces elasticus]